MSKCWNCGVQIMDPVDICPLCKCMVERTQDREEVQTYPYLDAERGIRKIQWALNIYSFCAIAAEMVLIGLVLWTGSGPRLPILLASFLAYGFLTLKVSIQMSTGYRLKMMMQTLLGIAVVFVIDMETGFRGWSLNFVMPGVFLLLDAVLLVLMLVNNRNWQSYIPMQLFVIALCVIPFVCYTYGFVTQLVVASIAMVVSLLFFLGTLIIGGRRARTELYRRFHM